MIDLSRDRVVADVFLDCVFECLAVHPVHPFRSMARSFALRARGLRSILEATLLDTMYDLPSLDGVDEVVINREVIEGRAQPLYVHGERK